MARDAIIDAIEAGIPTIVALTEHIPAHDVLDIFAALRGTDTRLIGPNTAGIVTPGEGFVGIMPGHNPTVFQPGQIGVISRSGSLGTLVCLNLAQSGLGQSAFIGIGGDPMIGTTTRDALMALDADPRTTAVAMVGEIGGSMEEEAAEYAATMKKPVVAFIAGRSAPPDKKMGHAGAIVGAGRGSYASKRAALKKPECRCGHRAVPQLCQRQPRSPRRLRSAMCGGASAWAMCSPRAERQGDGLGRPPQRGRKRNRSLERQPHRRSMDRHGCADPAVRVQNRDGDGRHALDELLIVRSNPRLSDAVDLGGQLCGIGQRLRRVARQRLEAQQRLAQ